MERYSKGSRGLEAYCKGGQGPPRAVTPQKKKKKKKKKKNALVRTAHHSKNHKCEVHEF
jgi:hypothetical protein